MDKYPRALLQQAQLGLMALLCLLLAACANPRALDQATQQMLALAETAWPGQFQLYRAGLRGDLQGYEVILVARHDANFRLRLDHRELNLCQPEVCRIRLQRAYARGRDRAAVFNASVAAFRACGVPMLGMSPGSESPLLELDLFEDSTTALARLTPCAEHYWKALGDAARNERGEARSWELHLRQPDKIPALMPTQISWETRPPQRPEAPLHVLWLRPDTPLPPSPAQLRLIVSSGYYKRLEAAILAEARRYLKMHLRGAELNAVAPRAWKMRPDPDDLNLLHAQVLACSPAALANQRGNCEEDIALVLRYDSRSGRFSHQRLLHGIRGHQGIIVLPPLLPDGDPPQPETPPASAAGGRQATRFNAPRLEHCSSTGRWIEKAALSTASDLS